MFNVLHSEPLFIWGSSLLSAFLADSSAYNATSSMMSSVSDIISNSLSECSFILGTTGAIYRVLLLGDVKDFVIFIILKQLKVLFF